MRERKNHVERILRCQYKLLGQPITDPEEKDLLVHLLRMHPNAPVKEGCGISHFSVREASEDYTRKTKCFWITRKDGSEVDFSFRKCLDNKDGQLPAKFYCEALRNEVADQITSFKRDSVKICAISGEKGVPGDPLEVDHHPISFQKLVDGWLAQEGITIFGVQMESNKMTDEDQRDSWTSYHFKHAGLRLILKSLHRGPGRNK